MGKYCDRHHVFVEGDCPDCEAMAVEGAGPERMSPAEWAERNAMLGVHDHPDETDDGLRGRLVERLGGKSVRSFYDTRLGEPFEEHVGPAPDPAYEKWFLEALRKPSSVTEFTMPTIRVRESGRHSVEIVVDHREWNSEEDAIKAVTAAREAEEARFLNRPLTPGVIAELNEAVVAWMRNQVMAGRIVKNADGLWIRAPDPLSMQRSKRFSVSAIFDAVDRSNREPVKVTQEGDRLHYEIPVNVYHIKPGSLLPGEPAKACEHDPTRCCATFFWLTQGRVCEVECDCGESVELDAADPSIWIDHDESAPEWAQRAVRELVPR